MPLAYATSSQTCPTCADLYRLRARNEAAIRAALDHYLTALRSASPLADLDEELRQGAAARTIIGYTIRRHRATRHACASVSA